MPTSKRVLTKWRTESLYALKRQDFWPERGASLHDSLVSHRKTLEERILTLTQELLDQKLLEDGK